MDLLHDVSRCHGYYCDQRQGCERYLQRERLDQRTTINDYSADDRLWCAMLIPVRETAESTMPA
jgi:hypothetical protein